MSCLVKGCKNVKRLLIASGLENKVFFVVQLFEPLTDAQKGEVLAAFGKNLKTMHEDIQHIREWFKKQPHLPETPKDSTIQAFLLMNKFRIEDAKKRLDMYYTVRAKVPEIFTIINPNRPAMKEYLDINYFVPLPKLTQDYCRVTVFKLTTCDADKFIPLLFFAATLNLGEIRFFEDFCTTNVFICDLGECKLAHLTKVTPALVKKIATIVEKVYTSRTLGLHFINCPSFADTFLRLLKSVLPPKISNRVYVHDSPEFLLKHFSKDMIPKDYGGEEKSLKEINEILKMKLEQYKDHFDHLDKLKVNESLRVGDPVPDDIFGYSGNFKKLDFD